MRVEVRAEYRADADRHITFNKPAEGYLPGHQPLCGTRLFTNGWPIEFPRMDERWNPLQS